MSAKAPEIKIAPYTVGERDCHSCIFSWWSIKERISALELMGCKVELAKFQAAESRYLVWEDGRCTPLCKEHTEGVVQRAREEGKKVLFGSPAMAEIDPALGLPNWATCEQSEGTLGGLFISSPEARQ